MKLFDPQFGAVKKRLFRSSSRDCLGTSNLHDTSSAQFVHLRDTSISLSRQAPVGFATPGVGCDPDFFAPDPK